MMSVVFAQAPTGVIDGGWGYVTAAYVATCVFFVGYALSLASRARAAERELSGSAPPPRREGP